MLSVSLFFQSLLCYISFVLLILCLASFCLMLYLVLCIQYRLFDTSTTYSVSTLRLATYRATQIDIYALVCESPPHTIPSLTIPKSLYRPH